MLSDIGSIQSLHHALADLSRLERSAIVVEAQYADFLNERRLAGRWPTARVARAFAELAVVHPRLPILFAGNRRLANQWTHRFFTAVATHWSNPQLDLVREAVADYRVQPSEPSIEERVRMAILSQDTMPVSLAEMVALLPEADTTRVRKELDRLTRAGILAKSGRGQAARWTAIKP